MIDQALRRFCESPHRTLIVIAGTFVVGLLLILPLVDVYCAGRSEKAGLLAELAAADQVAAGIDKFNARLAEKLAQLQLLEARTVTEESLPALRGKLVELAKDSGCNIRRLSVGQAMARPWAPGDSPMGTATDSKRTELKKGVLLEWRPVSVSVSGTSASLRSMVERVTGAGMLMHTKTLEMYPSSPTRQTLTLDMELWYYSLANSG
jgi:hypothetical protein